MSTPDPEALLESAARQIVDPDALIWMVERSPVATIVVGQDFRIELINAKTEFLFGYHRSELIGQPIEILVPDAVKEAHKGHTAKYASDPRSRPMGEAMALSGKHKTGKLFPVSIVLEPKMTTKGLKVLAVVLPKEVSG